MAEHLLEVLSFDPGETTGVVYCQVQVGGPEHGRIDLIRREQLAYRQRFLVKRLVELLQPHVVLVERYLLYKNKATKQINSTFETVRVIGMIELAVYLTWRSSGNSRPHHYVEQNASVMARVDVLPQHAKALQSFPHATSAYKHARYFVVDKREKLANYLVKPDGSPV